MSRINFTHEYRHNRWDDGNSRVYVFDYDMLGIGLEYGKKEHTNLVVSSTGVEKKEEELPF